MVTDPCDTSLLDRQEAWLKSYRYGMRFTEQGQLVSVGDGIVWISGLPSAQMDGLVVFADGSRAMVFDLCQDKLGAVLLDDTMRLTSGMPVFLAHEQLRVPCGDALAGRVVDPLGVPLDGLGRLENVKYRAIEQRSPPSTGGLPKRGKRGNMSRYRRVELHLQQLKKLQSIISSMKTLAQLELHKLAGGMASQRAMMHTLEQVAADFLMFYPRPVPRHGNALWLVFGSERSFCGNFNELLVRRLIHEYPVCREHPQRVLAVGRKLCERLDEALPGYAGLAGASAGEEIPSVLTQVVAATQKQLAAISAATLWVLWHNDEPSQIVYRRLLPPEEACLLPRRGHPPMLYSQPDRFFSDFLQHYLLLGLTQFCTVSLLAENRYRIRHLEGAVHRLDERLAALSSRARTLRQEEIIEEIEIILLGSGTFDPLSRSG